MRRSTRRQFLRDAALAGAAAAAAARPARSQPAGANERIRIAIAGLRGKGMDHLGSFHKIKDVEIVALCDPDRQVLDRAENRLIEEGGAEAARYTDIRKLLEDASIDALVIATPNHWHSLMAIWAVQAGKHVYVEKPVSHCVWEGRKLVEAAARTKKTVWVGTQKRSDDGIREAIAWLREGHLGKIVLSRGLCYKRRDSIGKVDGPTPIADYIDYDLWSGPREPKPLLRKQLHYDWHWVWDTGNGDIGNQGIHEMDVARWVAGHDGLPPRVLSLGGRFGYVDDSNTPNTQIAFYDYPGAPVLFEVRGLPMQKGMQAMDHFKGVRVGNVIHCENGYVVGGGAYDLEGKKVHQFPVEGGGQHQANFIRYLKSGKAEDFKAPILEGHLSSALCHLGNISYRLGAKKAPGEVEESIKSNHDLSEAFGRFREHLAKNGVEIGADLATLGPALTFDGPKERFTGAHAAEANALLKDSYRAPFTIPDKG